MPFVAFRFHSRVAGAGNPDTVGMDDLAKFGPVTKLKPDDVVKRRFYACVCVCACVCACVCVRGLAGRPQMRENALPARSACRRGKYLAQNGVYTGRVGKQTDVWD